MYLQPLLLWPALEPGADWAVYMPRVSPQLRPLNHTCDVKSNADTCIGCTVHERLYGLCRSCCTCTLVNLHLLLVPPWVAAAAAAAADPLKAGDESDQSAVAAESVAAAVETAAAAVGTVEA